MVRLGLWLGVVIWLAVCLVAQLHFAWLWVSGLGSPLRHEALIGAGMAALYGWPAAAGLGLLHWKWRDSAPLPVRAIGVVLFWSLVAVFVVTIFASELG
jgi:hypothetical protein